MTFFFTSFFMFWVFWRPQDWLFPWLYGLNILDVTVAMAALSLLMETDQKQIRFPFDMPQVYLLAGLWFAAIMSHAAQFYWAGVMWTIVPIFKICFFTLLLLCSLDRPSRLRTVAWIFVSMACMMSVHALMQQDLGYGFMGQLPIHQWRPETGQVEIRSLFFGIFEDPNDLAQILAASIPFAFVLSRRRTALSLALACGVTWLLVEAVLATHSRGGMLGLYTTAALMLGLLLPARWLLRLVVLGAIAALALCPYSGPHLDQSAHDRVVFWGEANWAFKQHPLFGVGQGMLPEIIGGERAIHNAFVGCYASIGVFGYWFWYGLIQLGIIGAWRARMALARPRNAQQAWLRRFAGMSIAALGSFCVSSYFLSRTFIYPFFFLFAVAGAVPFIVRDWSGRGRGAPLIEPRRDVYLYGSIGTLVSIAYIYVSIVLLNKVFYG